MGLGGKDEIKLKAKSEKLKRDWRTKVYSTKVPAKTHQKSRKYIFLSYFLLLFSNNLQGFTKVLRKINLQIDNKFRIFVLVSTDKPPFFDFSYVRRSGIRGEGEFRVRELL
jgi:hypothetical protein